MQSNEKEVAAVAVHYTTVSPADLTPVIDLSAAAAATEVNKEREGEKNQAIWKELRFLPQYV